MTSFSAPVSYSSNLTSTTGLYSTVDTTVSNITLTAGGIGYGTGTSTITIGGNTSVGSSSYILNNGAVSGNIGAGSGYQWAVSEEFVDCLPNLSRINEMCKQSPGLEIAFEKFKTVYKLVKDDYDTPEDKRLLP